MKSVLRFFDCVNYAIECWIYNLRERDPYEYAPDDGDG